MSETRRTTLRFDEVRVGDALPELEIPLTPTTIVAGAIASRDYQDVHHDRDLALERGASDIFMNILTTNGYVGRFVTDWAGPEAMLKRVDIRLGVPNYPYDSMRMTGRVSARSEAEARVTVEVRAVNRLGEPVTGTVDLVLPTGSA